MQLLGRAHLYPCTNSTLFEQYLRNIKTSYVQIFFVFQYNGKNQKRKWSPSKKGESLSIEQKYLYTKFFLFFNFFLVLLLRCFTLQGRSQDFSKGESHWVIQRVLTRLSPEYCGLFAYKKAYKGGVTGTPGPPWLRPCITKQSIPQKTKLNTILTILQTLTKKVTNEQINAITNVTLQT